MNRDPVDGEHDRIALHAQVQGRRDVNDDPILDRDGNLRAPRADRCRRCDLGAETGLGRDPAERGEDDSDGTDGGRFMGDPNQGGRAHAQHAGVRDAVVAGEADRVCCQGGGSVVAEVDMPGQRGGPRNQDGRTVVLDSARRDCEGWGGSQRDVAGVAMRGRRGERGVACQE